MKIKTYCLAIFLLTGFISPGLARGALLYLDPKNITAGPGQIMETRLKLNTKGQDINAIEGGIFYPSDLLELKEIRDGNSIITFWAQRPKDTVGKVEFSGVMPGGFNDSEGFILSLIFRAKSPGKGNISPRDFSLLLNDGQGTPTRAELEGVALNLLASSTAEDYLYKEIKDSSPPESFVPEISSGGGLFGGKNFIVFAAQDKGSGLDYFEVAETLNENEADGENYSYLDWKRAESPHILEDQSLKSFVYVKAVDKSGNFRVEKLVGSNKTAYSKESFKFPPIWSIIIVLAGGAVIALRNKIFSRGTKQ